jgi:hypothetical protein
MYMKTRFMWIVIWILVLATDGWADLTGRWSCDDGGTYYLRQTGRQLFWYGENNDSRPAWATVFSGRIYGKRIRGKWADVPKGRSTGSGELALVVVSDENTLRAQKTPAGYRGSLWNRQDPRTSSSRRLERLQPTGGDDCIPFDPTAIRVQQMDGRWKLVDGKHWLYDFGPDQAAAHQALKVIRHYRMDRLCSIGAAEHPSFSYLLAKGGSPSGAMAGEQCEPIDPARATVSKFQGSWKIVSGKRWRFDFGNRPTEARRALAIIRQHEFTHSCRVGRPDADFTYLRR